ncbi:Type-2 restriction enzyme EcoRII [compost metagenome]
MSETGDLFGADTEETSADSGELTGTEMELLRALDALYQASDKVAIKKLSRNDRGWAWEPKQGKQDGVYISQELRGDFFPPDELVPAREDKPHIRDMAVPVRWPQAPEDEQRDARYVRYTNKGGETHLTRIPRSLFAAAGPASLVVLGRTSQMPGLGLQAVLVDSASTVYGLLESRFDLRPDFQAGVFDSPADDALPERELDELQMFIDEAIEAVETGRLHLLLQKYAEMPAPETLSNQSRHSWLQQNPGCSLNPMELKNPGDAVRRIVSGIEFDLYRQHEVRTRGAKLIKLLLGDGAAPTVSSMVTRLVRDFSGFYSEMLNASQQRKARVGTGFETHIRSLLDAGAVPYAEQRVVSSLRPDFVLPNVELYQASSPHALVLSAKTTLRERWKQVTMEKRSCPVFLATMDEKVAVASVRKMKEHDVYLVVPEAFKAKTGVVVDFALEPNVLSFAEFFREEIAVRRAPIWKML